MMVTIFIKKDEERTRLDLYMYFSCYTFFTKNVFCTAAEDDEREMNFR